MDQNPYKAPAGDREILFSAAGIQRFIAAIFTATIWVFNAAVIALIALILAVCVMMLFAE